MSETDCEEVLREIELYLDGELPVDTRDEIRAHLEKCPPCNQRADFRQRLRELIASKCGCDEVPADLTERVQELLRDTGPS